MSNTVRPLDQEYREAFLIVAGFLIYVTLYKTKRLKFLI